ncbi:MULTISPECIES: formate dehydrogenase subunit delta [unclassified Acidiphilium]|jgi:formate dehydrogenase subunit delta|uniref:formate dehydrogenase subunit delta n=1 Tax=unclassified Acidiphilium TaxID=2617493 RepID=UPI000BDCD0E6|nr:MULTISPECIES: formate dehydrogenase subunit delta [unclassified Acidiphilium]OYV57317.1 MAG: formate dehydrogenase [Acidiphilium sp. 20-67-58]HQT60502.1 formate dehydrogenase subunit delta [Acidiphilium sp.]HQT72641.1 formate dehydrogenase subunit delta [Acidiphilium sp.]
MSPEDQDRKLVYMANQIATFFNTAADDEAVASIEAHIRKFWDPRMRAKIIAFRAHGGTGLTESAAAAVDRLSREVARA